MPKRRNPPWSREELILALDAYFRNGRQGLNKSSSAAWRLSDEVRALQIFPKELQGDDFRNPTGVSMKTYNLQALDPLRAGGLRGNGKRDRQVWDEFAADAEAIARAAESVRAAMVPLNGLAGHPPDKHDTPCREEGGRAYRLHLARERDSRVTARKLESVLSVTGSLACEVCGFDFAATYGEHGKGFAECHYQEPFATFDATNEPLMPEWVILCANCHRMIHWPPLRPMTVEELKGILARARLDQPDDAAVP